MRPKQPRDGERLKILKARRLRYALQIARLDQQIAALKEHVAADPNDPGRRPDPPRRGDS